MATLISADPLTLMMGSEDEDGETDAAQKLYLIVLDDKPADFAEVLTLAAPVTPVKGDADDAGRTCVKRNVARFPGAALTHYIISCDFEQLAIEAFEPNPLLREDEISFDIDSQSEQYFVDYSDPPKRIKNTVGDLFSRLPERTTGGVKMVIEGNRSTFNAAQAIEYTRPSATNSASVTVRGIPIATGQAKLVSMSGRPVSEGGYSFWRVKWEIVLAPDWLLNIENLGFTELDGDGVPWPILKGTPPEAVTSPWPLNEAGAALPNAADEPFILEFRPYPQKSFSVFSWTSAA